MFKRFLNTKSLLILIVIIASVLRLWKLSSNPVSLFGDELDVGYQAYSILKTGKDYYGNFMPIHFHSIAEWRTPLYLYSAVPTVAVFGITPLGVRLPAAIFGILTVVALYLLTKELTNENTALIASGVVAINPWAIQYSRAGFEVTLLLFLLLLGVYLFFRSLKNGNWLWLSVAALTLTPWVYSTAKLFTPLLMAFLFLFWRKEILGISRKYLLIAVVTGLLIGLPIAYGTFFGSGAQRFSYIGLFTDPIIEPEVGTSRLEDARARGEQGTGLKPTFLDRVIHNKFTFVGDNFLRNYLQPFSFDFLFNKGDPNPRHSIHNMGELYKVEVIALMLGLILFFSSRNYEVRTKALIAFWILVGVIPAALTRDGGNHATRLILILPPILFLVSVGIIDGIKLVKEKYRVTVMASYLLLLLMCFFFYQHNYWVHNPTYSERWWHYGWGPAVSVVKENEKDYDKVVISMAGEPAWIFFAGWYQYPPDKWQKEFPIGNDVVLPGIGKVSHIDKFYFGSPEGGLYDWGKVLNNKTLFLANAKEVNVNLIAEPFRTPSDLRLVKAVAFPSGEPAFYLLTGNK